MKGKVRNLRRVAAVMALVAVLGGATAPVAQAGKTTTTGSGKKWK